MPQDPRVDAYIEKQADFARPILTWLRARMHAACPEIDEAIKWSHPAFTYKGRIVAGMAAFKAHVSFGFWERTSSAAGAETEGLVQRDKLASTADLPEAAALEAQVRAAVALIDAGAKTRRAPRTAKPEAEVPPELAEALAGDAAASATFTGFPPGCRREYCEWIAEAKRPETKAKRVAEAVLWMREGKRRNWKYESC